MGEPASGAAVRADIARENWTGDKAEVVLQLVRLVDTRALAVGAAQSTLLSRTYRRSRPLPWLLLLLQLLLILLSTKHSTINASCSSIHDSFNNEFVQLL